MKRRISFLTFFQTADLRNYCGIFWQSACYFHDIESTVSGDFRHAETPSGAKKRMVLRRDFFHSNFKKA